MKKRYLLILALLTLFAVSGCSKKEDDWIKGSFAEVEGESAADVEYWEAVEKKNLQDKTEVQDKTEDSADNTTHAVKYDDTYDQKEEPDYKVEDYITVHNYIGMRLKDPGARSVTAFDVQVRLQETLHAYRNTYDKAGAVVQDGGIIDVDYQIEVDGEIYKSRENVRTGIGDHLLPKEVEKELVGKKAGDSVEVNVDYADDYFDKNLRGKTATVKATLRSVRAFYSLSNETIATLTNQKYQTVEAYMDYLYDDLVRSAEERRLIDFFEQIVNQMRDHFDLDGFPEDALAYHKDVQRRIYIYQFGPLEENETYQEKRDQIEEGLEEAAKESLVLEMVTRYIAEQEGITVTQEEYEKQAASLREDFFLNTPEKWDEYLAVYGEDSVMEDALLRKVLDFIIENADLY